MEESELMKEYKIELVGSYESIYKMLNSFYDDEYTFSKKDILFNFENERTMSLVIKGIMVTLINLKYIEVVSKVGHYNYLYKMNMRIEFKK